MKTMMRTLLIAIFFLPLANVFANSRPGNTVPFNEDWRFHLGDIQDGQNPQLDDSRWRGLDLPHDWSIEGEFSEKNPATPGGGALPGGTGWYRKTFTVSPKAKGKLVLVEFDGVYRNSEVWINGQYLGKRPYGYISFRYELTPYLKFGAEKNVIAVKVDNSKQPNSRWYSGSGIYRNVWLTTTDKARVEQWGTYITTPRVSDAQATIEIKTRVRNDSEGNLPALLTTIILDADGREVARQGASETVTRGAVVEIQQTLKITNPQLWSVDKPYLYKAVSEVVQAHKTVDRYETPFGIRSFSFDKDKGFFLNGKPLKILGVCDHHDLGSLGAAVNTRALERQLEMLRDMGVNGLRTSHNPPAPELLELCDRLGFIVMDEAFDMWKKGKTDFDYHLDWDEWHKRDLQDMVLRDRNHPSVFIWSIGNEVAEQWSDNDANAGPIAKELAGIVRALDKTRPVTAACNNVSAKNGVIASGALDLVGTNYAHERLATFPELFAGQKIIGTETTSALATRGSYDLPSDKIRRWPPRWDLPLKDGNADFSCSAYDNCSTPWGSTHEETWKLVKSAEFFSGMFIWTGWDYLGEPTPYSWPARSSYFGIIDLAGFPKDVYYMYQSEWTTKPVLHIFPHWNWKAGDVVDVWAYSNSDEVELFLNGNSLGTRRKEKGDLHLMWRVPYHSGILEAVSRTGGKQVLATEVRTAWAPHKIVLSPDRSRIKADGKDLSFVTVRIVDENGTLVPNAENLVTFSLTGGGQIAGVDNGSQISHESFTANQRQAFKGMCLVIVKAGKSAGRIRLTATSPGLQEARVELRTASR
jgi:beta-galactosidase